MVIGFLVLSHNHPQQVLRLVRTLNRVYGDPPISCHHDTSQSAIDPAQFPSNVQFVSPAIPTGWGKWAVVEAAMAALRRLYAGADPDWFVLLSGADYPIAPAARVRADLAEAGVDALIDYREAGSDPETALAEFGPRNPALDQFEAPGNREMLHARYKGAEVWLPMIRFNTPQGTRLGRYTVHLPFENPWHPFSADFRCFYGDHWFSGSRKAARVLLNPTRRELRLQRYLYRRTVPEECYYQTVLCNRGDVRVARDNRRFTEWNGGGAHPALLTAGDLPQAIASGAHFARKFRPDDPVLDLIDAYLGGSAA